MMRKPRFMLITLSVLLMSCSGDDAGSSGTGSGDHVWKDQVETMDRARAAEQKMLDAAEAQRQAIEEQTR